MMRMLDVFGLLARLSFHNALLWGARILFRGPCFVSVLYIFFFGSCCDLARMTSRTSTFGDVKRDMVFRITI